MSCYKGEVAWIEAKPDCSHIHTCGNEGCGLSLCHRAVTGLMVLVFVTAGAWQLHCAPEWLWTEVGTEQGRAFPMRLLPLGFVVCM